MGIFAASLMILACNEPLLQSNWRQAAVEGAASDSLWNRSLMFLDEPNMGIGLQNDADNLYIFLKAINRAAQIKIMRNGLTVWLDAVGKKNKTFGIHYPIGMQNPGMPLRGYQPPGAESGELRRQFAQIPDTMEIIGPHKNERNSFSVRDIEGLTVSLHDSLGVMIYELTIPLRRSDELPYGIGVGPGKAIGLGLETGQFKREMTGENSHRGGKMPGGRGGGRPDGGFGFPGGRGRMRPPGNEGGMGFEPIKVWAKVILASPGGARN
jgi:hypothetical protein